MAKKHRVVFSFDERSLKSLKTIQEQGHYATMAETVRDSIQIRRALQSQLEQGFTEIVVRNPKSNEERVMVIPGMDQAAAG